MKFYNHNYIIKQYDYAAEEARVVRIAGEVRDVLHPLDIDNNPQDRAIYEDKMFDFVNLNEGLSLTSYGDKDKPHLKGKIATKDREGNITVGYGFNMERKNAKEVWQEIIGDKITPEQEDALLDQEMEFIMDDKFTEDDNRFFDAVFDMKIDITEEQARALYKYDTEDSENECKRIFSDDWFKFKANERLMIKDCHYNLPALVSKNTQFYKHMKAYAKGSDPKDLGKALYEIRERSNGGESKGPGIAKRRAGEAAMGDSTKCIPYLKPKDMIPVKAVINETIVPKYRKGEIKTKHSDRYYIWRTSNDFKVRNSCKNLEGKICDNQNPPAVGNPGHQHNCRCTADYDIPEAVTLPDDDRPDPASTNINKSSPLFNQNYIEPFEYEQFSQAITRLQKSVDSYITRYKAHKQKQMSMNYENDNNPFTYKQNQQTDASLEQYLRKNNAFTIYLK